MFLCGSRSRLCNCVHIAAAHVLFVTSQQIERIVTAGIVGVAEQLAPVTDD